MDEVWTGTQVLSRFFNIWWECMRRMHIYRGHFGETCSLLQPYGFWGSNTFGTQETSARDSSMGHEMTGWATRHQHRSCHEMPAWVMRGQQGPWDTSRGHEMLTQALHSSTAARDSSTGCAALQTRLRTRLLHCLRKQKSSLRVTERTSSAIQEKGEAPSELLKAQSHLLIFDFNTF